MADEEFKRLVYERVLARLLARRDTPALFLKHWQGKSAGIEMWLKAEFVAAIDPSIATVRSGGAGGWNRGGCKCPDVILTKPNGSEFPVEIKGGISRWWIGDDVSNAYRGCIIAFITQSTNPINSKHRQMLITLDPDAMLGAVCEITKGNGTGSICFGMVDLR